MGLKNWGPFPTHAPLPSPQQDFLRLPSFIPAGLLSLDLAAQPLWRCKCRACLAKEWEAESLQEKGAGVKPGVEKRKEEGGRRRQTEREKQERETQKRKKVKGILEKGSSWRVTNHPD